MKQMKSPPQLILMFCIAFALSACGAIEHGMRESRRQMPKVMQIENGITKEALLKLMEMPPINRQMSTAPNGTLHEALQWDLGSSPRATQDFPERDMLVVYLRNGRVTDIETFPDAHGRFITIHWENRPGFIIK